MFRRSKSTRMGTAHSYPLLVAERFGQGLVRAGSILVLLAWLIGAACAFAVNAQGADARALPEPQPMSRLDAVRLADQASFGPTEALLAEMEAGGARRWIAAQIMAPVSRYVRGGDGAIHRKLVAGRGYCDGKSGDCWRDYESHFPLTWDFYQQAVEGRDQLRQRVAFALQQILVVSFREVQATYGMREYHNMLRERALGNYREILKGVTLSPVMGDYLSHVNNDPAEPNENFARELLQLFALGTCRLNQDGSLESGRCIPTYDNAVVREYAFALTGWTYPPGGSTSWGCNPKGTNCRYYDGEMVAVASRHNAEPRQLLANVNLAEGHSASEALEKVLDSVMAHPNLPPFLARQMIQKLVTSNPSPSYVMRVARAFEKGRFEQFGNGVRGDMQALVAAVLLDPEARETSPPPLFGRLREPVHLYAASIRVLDGLTDGYAFVWDANQPVFRPPSVFNFYPPDYPLPGTRLVAPEFGIQSGTASMDRINFLHKLLFWEGWKPHDNMPKPTGTRANLQRWMTLANQPEALVDAISRLALGQKLPVEPRRAVVEAVAAINLPETDDKRQEALGNRVKQAAYLVLASPEFQVIR